VLGHSLGATVAFELVHELRRRGRPLPRHLFVSGALAPDDDDPEEPLHTIAGDDEFVMAVAERFGGVPREVLEHEELRRLIAPALRADLAIHETYHYVPREPLALGLTAYGGSDDTRVGPEALQRWRAHTTGSFSTRIFPGSHFFLQTARDALLADLAAQLEKA
jgi:medium-chain acyl-[acyl-carrier-protein] hydrolase